MKNDYNHHSDISIVDRVLLWVMFGILIGFAAGIITTFIIIN